MTIYKARTGVVLTEICGEYLLVAAKEARNHCPYVTHVNETGAFLWKCLINGSTAAQLKEELMKDYEIPDENTAECEIEIFLEQLTIRGCIIAKEREM